MPFTVRCPHCKRYMLIEDELHGSSGKCLVCNQGLLLDPTASAQLPSQTPLPSSTPNYPPASQTPTVAIAPPAAELEVRQCPNPNCKARMRVPAAARGKRVTCPKCRQAFV